MLKINTDLNKKLKMFTNNNCFYVTDFIIKKVKFDFYLFLLL